MERRVFLGWMGMGLAASVAKASENTPKDIYLGAEEMALIASLSRKLTLVEKTVGHGKFNLISFDETLKIAKNYPKIETFSSSEIAYIEKIFYTNPTIYGFYGKQTVQNLTDLIPQKEVIKISGTGHYLFKENATGALNRMIKDVGSTLILTSGVRSVVKQLHLYVDKIESEGGNISSASRAIAPPAYSYHSIGDFDVGKRGWGHENFTPNFARTQEFWRLQKLPYISMRYGIGNKDGVRFEPWHIQIV